MSLTFASSVPRGAVVGQPPTFGIIKPEALLVEVDEIINNGSAFGGSFNITRQVAFTGSTQDAGLFSHGAAFESCYFCRPIENKWQGATIKMYALVYHKAAALTGTGSPPDDQVRLEVGWETLADLTAYVDIGVQNDGTAPHEANNNVQLGTAIDSPLYLEVAEIAIGASDRILHGRFTRDANDGTNDGLGAGMYCIGLFFVIPGA